MPVTARAPKKRDYPQHPPGLFSAVCCDVVDLGMQENKFKAGKMQHKVRIVWQTEEIYTDPTGEFPPARYTPSGWYTLSLHEKATLRQHLEAWRGRAFTEEELDGFDLEKLIGVNCQLSIVANTVEGKTYSNVNAIVQTAKGAPKISVVDYVRVKDREGYIAPINPLGPLEAETEANDGDVPF
jgi:hypothetical protein